MEPQIFRVSPTNWLRFWLISAPAASTNHDNVVRRKWKWNLFAVAHALLLALKLAAKLWQQQQQQRCYQRQRATSNNSNLQPPNHRQRPTTTILSALKRCNYFMPDNNLILSMLQNVQAANKCDSCGIRGVFCRVQTVWVRLMVAKCKLVAVAVFSFLYPYANQGEPVAFCCSKLIGF